MRTNRLAASAALIAAGLLAGCGGGGSDSGSHTALSASAKTAEGLTATMTEDRATVAKGGSVTYTLTLTNNTSQPITYQTLEGCGIDQGREGAAVRVTNAGAQVYPDPLGAVCAANSTRPPVTLAPGASVSDTFSPPGAFAFAGSCSATATFITQAPEAARFRGTQVGPLTVNVQ